VVTAQCLSGTGALRIGFELLRQEAPSQVFLPNPTWSNHENIIKRAGLNFSYYPYYDPATKKVKISSLL
jgi:aspartate/tyrosine/aromatic aminotransferase